MCDATLNGGPLTCVQQGEHVTHVFHTSSGSDVPDRHDATSGGEH